MSEREEMTFTWNETNDEIRDGKFPKTNFMNAPLVLIWVLKGGLYKWYIMTSEEIVFEEESLGDFL